MCYGAQRPFSRDDLTPYRSPNQNAVAVENLRGRLAETEARLRRARAREALLNRRLEEMKRFVSVMEILETFLRRRFLEQRDLPLLSLPPTRKECIQSKLQWREGSS